METYLRSRNRPLFDYPRWAEPLKEVIRKNAERLAEENGKIEHIRHSKFDKEERIGPLVGVKPFPKKGHAPGNSLWSQSPL
jgi:hypothetical protein